MQGFASICTQHPLMPPLLLSLMLVLLLDLILWRQQLPLILFLLLDLQRLVGP